MSHWERDQSDYWTTRALPEPPTPQQRGSGLRGLADTMKRVLGEHPPERFDLRGLRPGMTILTDLGPAVLNGYHTTSSVNGWPTLALELIASPSHPAYPVTL